MQTPLEYLCFDGLSGRIELRVDQRFRDALPTVFPNWPFEITTDAGDSFASVTQSDGGYTITSPFMDGPSTFNDPANTICALIVELAWARLHENPELLCLHGAAVEFAGRLIIFPSTRRAGKSTLTVALAAAGKRVFTDDFLPLAIQPNGEVHGVASGISPRLRLPAPIQIGPQALAYISARNMIANRQYQFVEPRADELANFGDTAPIGGMIFLDRQDGATATLESVTNAEALSTLITQNFSRAVNAAGILKMLDFITTSATAYRLTYDTAEEAIALLNAQFQTWEGTPPTLSDAFATEFLTSALDITAPKVIDVTEGQFMQADSVTVITSEGKKFLTGRAGQSIHYLNDGAAMIWQLLDEPTSIVEAVTIIHTAFPEQPFLQIQTDVTATFTEFAQNSLLQTAEICKTEEIEANCTDNPYQRSVFK